MDPGNRGPIFMSKFTSYAIKLKRPARAREYKKSSGFLERNPSFLRE